MSEKRYCTTCQRPQPSQGGYTVPHLSRGWRCQQCAMKARKHVIRAAIYRKQLGAAA